MVEVSFDVQTIIKFAICWPLLFLAASYIFRETIGPKFSPFATTTTVPPDQTTILYPEHIILSLGFHVFAALMALLFVALYSKVHRYIMVSEFVDATDQMTRWNN